MSEAVTEVGANESPLADSRDADGVFDPCEMIDLGARRGPLEGSRPPESCESSDSVLEKATRGISLGMRARSGQVPFSSEIEVPN